MLGVVFAAVQRAIGALRSPRAPIAATAAARHDAAKVATTTGAKAPASEPTRTRQPSPGELLARRLAGLIRARQPRLLVLKLRNADPLCFLRPAQLHFRFLPSALVVLEPTAAIEIEYDDLLAAEFCR